MQYGIKIIMFAVLICIPESCFAADETQEPQLQYKIRLQDKEFPLRIGEKISIKGNFVNPTIELEAAPYKHFTYGEVAFDYPASFTWEAALDGELRNWTLSGNDFKIMLFRTSQPFTPEALSKQTIATIGGSELKDCTRVLGGIELKGKCFDVAPGGHKITNQAYALKVRNGYGVLLFQDSSDTENLSSEGQAAIKVLERTFKLK